jgi:chaperonin GroEL (HSP60 family)
LREDLTSILEQVVRTRRLSLLIILADMKKEVLASLSLKKLKILVNIIVVE